MGTAHSQCSVDVDRGYPRAKGWVTALPLWRVWFTIPFSPNLPSTRITTQLAELSWFLSVQTDEQRWVEWESLLQFTCINRLFGKINAPRLLSIMILSLGTCQGCAMAAGAWSRGGHVTAFPTAWFYSAAGKTCVSTTTTRSLTPEVPED